MTEAGIEMSRENLGGVEEIVDLGLEVDPTLGIKMKKGGIPIESQDIL